MDQGHAPEKEIILNVFTSSYRKGVWSPPQHLQVISICMFLVILLAYFILQGSESDLRTNDCDLKPNIIGYRPSADRVPLDPLTIPKFVNQSSIPPAHRLF